MTKLSVLTPFMLFLVISFTMHAQKRTLTGNVVHEDSNMPLQKVFITCEGDSDETFANEDGSFKIEVDSDTCVLVFSLPGFKRQRIIVHDQLSHLHVKLKANSMVNIGYAVAESKNAPGVIAHIENKHFNKGLIASPEQLIQGKAAGVQITSSSGGPGAEISTIIRGASTLRNGNPLFVLDGVPLTEQDVSPRSFDLGLGNASSKNPLNFINPSDINTIDILKDGYATAIYGTRAANGIIMITTKDGVNKRKQLEYGAAISFSKVARQYDLLDRDQYLNSIAELGYDTSYYDHKADTDWQKIISRATTSQQHNLAFSNDYGSGHYRAAVSFDEVNGVIRNSGFERMTARVNANHSFAKGKLNAAVRFNFSRTKDETPPITENAGSRGDLLGAAYIANPTRPATNDQAPDYINPLALINYTSDDTKTDRRLINAYFDYRLLNKVNLHASISLDHTGALREAAYSPLLGINGDEGYGRAYLSALKKDSRLMEYFLTYKSTSSISSLEILAGYAYQDFSYREEITKGWGFNSTNTRLMIDDLKNSLRSVESSIDRPYLQFGYGEDGMFINTLSPVPRTHVINSSPVKYLEALVWMKQEEQDKLQSFFARAHYSIRNKYILGASLRADGSSRFSPEHKYGVFPAAYAAWRLSEEPFAPKVFDDLKLYISYGITGNQDIPHLVYQLHSSFYDIDINSDGRILVPGFGREIYNPNIKWQQNSQVNFGINYELDGGRVHGRVDLYHKKTSDMLLYTFGAFGENFFSNADGAIYNKGIEMDISFTAFKRGNFLIDLLFNGSYNRNTVKGMRSISMGTLYGQVISGSEVQRIRNGYPLFFYHVPEFTGFDDNGFSTYSNDRDEIHARHAVPDYNLGFMVSMKYGNVYLSSSLFGQFGHYIYNNTANAYFVASMLVNGRNVPDHLLNSDESGTNAPHASSRFLEKGDFVRMQNLEIGYHITLSKKRASRQARVYALAQNLFVITKYSGLDPEANINHATGENSSFGIDYSSYPRAKTITLGIQVKI